MNSEFVKFPTTPHIAVLEGVEVRADKVMTTVEQREFLSREVVIEEKIDGANLGISFDNHGELLAQNRGSYLRLPGAGQWQPLSDWLQSRAECLFEHLADRYILFGEWCYASHSVYYDCLFDWFLGFDLYDKRRSRFASCETRNEYLERMNVYCVPTIASGKFSFSEIKEFLQQSQLGPDLAEGLYLRCNARNWLANRAKLVRPDFLQSVQEHWSQLPLRVNRLREWGLHEK